MDAIIERSDDSDDGNAWSNSGDKFLPINEI
jgi:hypothetical protein